MVARPTSLEPKFEVRRRHDFDPASGKWVSKYSADMDDVTFFKHLPRGTEVIAQIFRPKTLCCPRAPGFPPDSPGFYLTVLWGVVARRDTDDYPGYEGWPVYYWQVCLRESLQSSRAIVPSLHRRGRDYALAKDSVSVEELRLAAWASYQGKLADAAQRVEEQAGELSRARDRRKAFHAAQAVKASALGLSLEDYQTGERAARQLRRSTAPGHCRVCKRPLTVPESLARGVGPECFKAAGLAFVIESVEGGNL